MKNAERENLDKYYTKSSVAKFCYDAYVNFLSSKIVGNVLFVEPSAGSGSFLNLIEYTKLGFDIAPENSNIVKLDFLKDSIKKYIKSKNVFIIGNPPFGSKSKLAIDFLNTSLKYSKYVGFIVPIQFRKYGVQRNIKQNARLVLDIDLDDDSFTFAESDYNVSCCFQIWTTDKIGTDLRIINQPDVEHSDFKLFQYNATVQAEKYFDYDWDFAVLRQGYGDFSEKYYKTDKLDKKKQWIFFKAKNKKILDRLMKLDFVKLSEKNTKTKGFGKQDVIKEYVEIYGVYSPIKKFFKQGV